MLPSLKPTGDEPEADAGRQGPMPIPIRKPNATLECYQGERLCESKSKCGIDVASIEWKDINPLVEGSSPSPVIQKALCRTKTDYNTSRYAPVEAMADSRWIRQSNTVSPTGDQGTGRHERRRGWSLGVVSTPDSHIQSGHGLGVRIDDYSDRRWFSMVIPSVLKAMLPSGLRRRLRRLRSTRNYESLYESLARALPPNQSIGGGDYELIGRISLGVLLMEGLKPGDTLVDLGCGTGRLAVQVIPWLGEGGRYIGIDISKTMLAHARVLIDQKIPSPSCSVQFLHQTTPDFPLLDKSIDMVCAFSVFTHMEHEDNYRYLRGARRIIKDEGRFIYSCWPIELADARAIFVAQTKMDAVERWASVRNLITSRELMDTTARLAGWEPVRWYPGDEAHLRLAGLV